MSTDRETEIELSAARAALRILAILNRWMIQNPESFYLTRVTTGGVEIALMTPATGAHFFYGVDVQDAYGQAAQTIEYNGGSL